MVQIKDVIVYLWWLLFQLFVPSGHVADANHGVVAAAREVANTVVVDGPIAVQHLEGQGMSHAHVFLNVIEKYVALSTAHDESFMHYYTLYNLKRHS